MMSIDLMGYMLSVVYCANPIDIDRRLEDHPPRVSFALSLRFDAIVALRTLFRALDSAFPTCLCPSDLCPDRWAK